jgi:NADH-quinone oxidoreductase subunit M
MPDLFGWEFAVMAPLIALIVFLGVYPKPALDRITPSVDELIAHVEEHTDYRQPAVAKEGPAAAVARPVEAESEEEHG